MSAFKHWNLSESGMAFDSQTGESFHLNETARHMLRLHSVLGDTLAH